MIAINMSHSVVAFRTVYPKLFVGLQTLKIGVPDAVVCFNESSAARYNVLEVLGMNPGDNMAKALAAIDRL
jgi:hypothetical protein